MPSLSPLVINYCHSQPSVVAHPRELLIGYSMGYGVGATFSVFIMTWRSKKLQFYKVYMKSWVLHELIHNDIHY